ncbi:MAG: ATP-binding protein [Candidatus Sericytochromatia bacterium]
MLLAPIPTNEKQRIESLKTYNILDTLPEKTYDDLTMLASYICETPISVISFVDQDRHWFKSKIGLNATETPRNVGFCAHAIMKDEMFIISDTLQDARFVNNPLVVSEPNIRFYAGAPITTTNGEILGEICVIDNKPRELNESQVKALEALGRQVMIQLELRKTEIYLLQQQSLLENSNKELESFAHTVSHDLKTPLRAISSYSQLLSRRYKDKLDEQANEYIKNINDGCNNMKLLIEDVLSYSKVNNIQNQDQETNLNIVLSNVIQNMDYIIKENNVRIIYDTLPIIKVKPTYMFQIFMNLFSNAIKFQKKTTQPIINISVEKVDNEWIFSVSDNGIGIEKENINKLFKLFSRLHKEDEIEGSGIGLSNCKKIVELYGGKIWVESEFGQGSTFYFTFPIKT